MAINDSTLKDEDGDYSDWIEIYNPTSNPINLGGWVLTDDKSDSLKWVFPPFILDATEYLVVFASGKNKRVLKDSLHTNFKITGQGEYLALIKPGGAEKTTVFNAAYPEQYENISYGQINCMFYYFNKPSPGTANSKGSFLRQI